MQKCREEKTKEGNPERNCDGIKNDSMFLFYFILTIIHPG